MIWLTESDVLDLVNLNEAVVALEQGLSLEVKGHAHNLEKVLGVWANGGSMHTLGSMMPERGYVGFKTWAHTPGGATALFSLFDANDGRLLCVMEAASLGQTRTSAISGVATQLMADKWADDMALIGTGAQALTQAAAVQVVRPLRRVRVFSRTPDKRAVFCAKARDALGCEVVEAHSVEEAVKNAPIISLITRASEAFLHADMIAKGAHVNAAGAILPGKHEIAQDVFARVSSIVVDNLANARKGSQELIDRLGASDHGWATVRTLGEVIAAGEHRSADADVTLFKPMGMGLSDLSVAIAAYERARERGIGLPIAQPKRGTPRWTPAFGEPAA
ncbi:MAG TPA: ornithine cyclodeaminase family protein [Sphingobium sp.]|uniref:ornithine cyclodeaminase family protein n=1 Tax=Sphingobium sp. TaxID=1912891 RepID=UPI002ED3EED4